MKNNILYILLLLFSGAIVNAQQIATFEDDDTPLVTITGADASQQTIFDINSENPDKTGLNKSDKCLYILTNQVLSNEAAIARPTWAGNVFYITFEQPITITDDNRFLHIMHLKERLLNPWLVYGDNGNGTFVELARIPCAVENTWFDMVIDVKAKMTAVKRFRVHLDGNWGSDIMMARSYPPTKFYYDNIELNNSPEARIANPGEDTDTKRPLNETKHVMWGQGYGENSLKRLPDHYESSVPEGVWTRMTNPTGMQVRFRTNATNIAVNYINDAPLYTATEWYSNAGANGFDMYARKDDGKWLWCYPNNIVFGNTFTFSNIDPVDPAYAATGYEYCLYLPSFIPISSLTITVNTSANFEFIPVTDKKPIVFYGTSVIHGAVSSRAGNIITNIISRELYDTPIINLGIRGIARMEPEVIRAVNDIEAQIYVLDCVPNLLSGQLISTIKNRYIDAIEKIKAEHPDAAIIMSEHAGFADMEMYSDRKNKFTRGNEEVKKAYDEVLARGYSSIYYLSTDDLGLNPATDFGDYGHPNDKGMYIYAQKYLNLLRKVQADLEAITTIQKKSKDGKFKIYPNPVADELTIESSEPIKEASIFTPEGRLVMKENNPSGKIPLQGLLPGVYVMKISTESITETKRILKK